MHKENLKTSKRRPEKIQLIKLTKFIIKVRIIRNINVINLLDNYEYFKTSPADFVFVVVQNY
jgi:hypothetical protein